MKENYILISILFTLVSCNSYPGNNSDKSLTKDSFIIEKNKEVRIDSIFWMNSKVSQINIDQNLSHQIVFKYDSVIGVDYIGFNGEHSYYPINEKGQWLSTFINSKILSNEQVIQLNGILGKKATYQNPNIVGCYEPRLAFVYFKENKVIGQTQICLSCAQLRSTIRTVGNEYGGLINQKAIDNLNKLRVELGLTSKMKWE